MSWVPRELPVPVLPRYFLPVPIFLNGIPPFPKPPNLTNVRPLVIIKMRAETDGEGENAEKKVLNIHYRSFFKNKMYLLVFSVLPYTLNKNPVNKQTNAVKEEEKNYTDSERNKRKKSFNE